MKIAIFSGCGTNPGLEALSTNFSDWKSLFLLVIGERKSLVALYFPIGRCIIYSGISRCVKLGILMGPPEALDHKDGPNSVTPNFLGYPLAKMTILGLWWPCFWTFQVLGALGNPRYPLQTAKPHPWRRSKMARGSRCSRRPELIEKKAKLRTIWFFLGGAKGSGKFLKKVHEKNPP